MANYTHCERYPTSEIVAWYNVYCTHPKALRLVLLQAGRRLLHSVRASLRVETEVAGQMGKTAESLNSRFVISVGDNFYEVDVRSATDPRWHTSFEDIYTARSLQVPWYVALGHHDYRGVPQAQIDYAAGSPRWRMPGRYYKVSVDAASLTLEFRDYTGASLYRSAIPRPDTGLGNAA